MKSDSILKIPHNSEAEQAILGRLIVCPSELIKIISKVKTTTFFIEAHQHIFRSMLSLFEAKQPIDEITLGDELNSKGKLEEIGGYGYLAELSINSPPQGNIEYWSELIAEEAMLRDLISITSDISRKARDPQQNIAELLIEATNKIKEIASSRSSNDVRLLGDVLVECFQEMEVLSNTDNSEIGLATGFEDIDRLIGGLMPGDLMIIGARPGMGKSALVLNILTYVSLRYQEYCLLFSREMQKKKLAKRALSSEGRINQFFLKTGKSNLQEDWDRLARTSDRLQKAMIYLDDKTKKIDEMVYKAHSLHSQNKNGLKLIAFDYLQKIHGNGERVREQEVSAISAKLKDLAMDLNVPVIALAQLNRELEKRDDKRPQLSDLRESGAIEQDADIICFIYRDEVYNPETTQYKGVAEIDFQKVRDGSPGLVNLRFEGKFTKFSSI